MNRVLLPILATLLLMGCQAEHGPALDIWTAAASGDIEILQQHITSGTDLNAKDPAGGSSPLVVAALLGQTEAAQFLIDHGANLESTNNDGSTALHVAAFFCHPEMVALLLANGADTEVKNGFGHTPLETVSGDWTPEVEDTYNMIAGAWQLELDLKRIEEVRPQVAALIRQHAER